MALSALNRVDVARTPAARGSLTCAPSIGNHVSGSCCCSDILGSQRKSNKKVEFPGFRGDPYNDQRVRPENGEWPNQLAIRTLDALTSSSRLTDGNTPSR